VAVRLVLRGRRWFCDNPACPQRIFSERVPGLVCPHGRRTERWQALQQAIGLALGGEAGARLAHALGMPVRVDTLRRQLHHAPVPAMSTPRVLGVDDWAYRRGQQYGTILVDLERHRTVAWLPDREAASLAQWLQTQPGVEMISRDRAEGYAKGARDGAPTAGQVADRWHRLKNLREGVQQLLSRHHRELQQVAEAHAAHDWNPSPPATPCCRRRRRQAARPRGRLPRPPGGPAPRRLP
jgi:transposase